ncbi:hypothetical protein M9Y10_035874 [Tritrichomonas musculus]|uniref:Uncharacterized protein n=1 Tax=Tritrichomonas musculus TaxID=1915356 RepID=A0ABR2GX15_9EUKA
MPNTTVLSFTECIHSQQAKQMMIKNKQIQISALFSWFLPEILDFKNENVISSCSSIYQDSICRYYPAKNEEYKKKRDNGELDDSLAQALIHDDLESLQKIIANYEIIII